MRRGLALKERAGPSAYPHPVPLIWFRAPTILKRPANVAPREADWARDHSDETHATERLSYLALAEFQAGH